MDDWTTLFQTAGQYYVAGRYSAFAGFIPVAGNLLHHAVEMYLKGGLSKKGYNRALIKDLGHDLERIWERFKNEYPDPALNTFDQVIPRLDRFEGIRYPGPKLDQGSVPSSIFHARSPCTLWAHHQSTNLACKISTILSLYCSRRSALTRWRSWRRTFCNQSRSII